jgi:hypothetical protein
MAQWPSCCFDSFGAEVLKAFLTLEIVVVVAVVVTEKGLIRRITPFEQGIITSIDPVNLMV